MGGLRLDRRDSILRGGKSGPAVTPGRPDDSLLYQVVAHRHERLKMPPQGKLKPAEIEAIRTWIENGVHFDSPAAAVESASTRAKEFWAFKPVGRPAVPAVINQAWPQSEIDRFILKKLEEKGLSPAPRASKRTLLRRMTYDLTGLPPTPKEMADFLADGSPQAVAKVADRLLASPHYGERWGRFWLDVARYAEDDALGLSADPFPNAWRYRDWVIQAFNDDMPYDVFVRAQIAGDSMDKPGENRYRPGLGLFGLGPWYYKLVEPPKARADERHDRVDVLTRGFLGLTVACARCHDHKYDPIPTTDYYALAGVFANTELHEEPLASGDVVEQWHGKQKAIEKLEADLKKSLDDERQQLGRRLAQSAGAYLAAARRIIQDSHLRTADLAAANGLDEETLQRWVEYAQTKTIAHPYLTDMREPAEFQTFLSQLTDEQRAIQEYNRKVLEEAAKSTDPYDLFCKGCSAETRTLARDKFVLWTDLFGAKQQTNEKLPGLFYYADQDLDRWLNAEVRVRIDGLRAEIRQRKAELPPRYPFLHVIADAKTIADLPLHRRGDPYSLGAPVPRGFLTALSTGEPVRFHNGSGRAELAEVIASRDNPLTARVIVNRVWHYHFGAGLVRTLSNFGQVGDRPSHPELLDYLASRLVQNGWSLKRLHREILLSSVYASSSSFNEAGFKADPENRLLWRANRRRLDVEALRDSLLFVGGSLDTKMGGPSDDWRSSKRRSIYGKVSRYRLERMLTLFDFPDPTMHAEQRASTNTPLQRLFFLNSELVQDEAQALSKRIQGIEGSDTDRLRFAYNVLYGRDPDKDEEHVASEYLAKGGTWADYAQVLLSTNEFQFLD